MENNEIREQQHSHLDRTITEEDHISSEEQSEDL
jgi:hypothetical protein